MRLRVHAFRHARARMHGSAPTRLTRMHARAVPAISPRANRVRAAGRAAADATGCTVKLQAELLHGEAKKLLRRRELLEARALLGRADEAFRCNHPAQHAAAAQ